MSLLRNHQHQERGDPSIEGEFIAQAIFRINESTQRVEKCLEHLSEVEIWQKPNSTLNSVGNLILHLCGNIGQYIVSSLGENPDSRIRDEEFSATGGLTRAELLSKLKITTERANAIISRQEVVSLSRSRNVQAYTLSGIGIVLHVVEHYSYHTGQIVFWTKLLKEKDLGFYAGVDLNQKNTF